MTIALLFVYFAVVVFLVGISVPSWKYEDGIGRLITYFLIAIWPLYFVGILLFILAIMLIDLFDERVYEKN